MKKITLPWALFVGCWLSFASPAHGDPFALSLDTKIYWDTVKLTSGPGLSITWLPLTYNTTALQFLSPAFYSSCCATGTVVVTSSADNWGSLSYSSELGGISASAEATATELSASVVWPNAQPGLITDEMVISREGAFVITGSGNMTFSVDYSFAANRFVDSTLLPNPETAGFMELNFFLYTPYVTTYAGTQVVENLPFVRGSVNDPVSQSGTATFSYSVSDGTYWLRAQGSSFGTVAVPEPSTLTLLSMGLAVIGAANCGRRRERK